MPPADPAPAEPPIPDPLPIACRAMPRPPGPRFTVAQVLAALAAGQTCADLLVQYPYLTEADLAACRAFAAARAARGLRD